MTDGQPPGCDAKSWRVVARRVRPQWVSELACAITASSCLVSFD
ncbi:hypothetical protein [Micromonospora craterilacus]|nr:hypothetical protein [Micromonospora craterilacus]